ncbi:MAG: DNA polymerase Y family protein [Acidimicrobiales bacterium]|jgi:protein ImuB
MTRTLVVWCPDWPLVAAGLAQVPSVVLRGNRVTSSSSAARAEGVRLRQRRREAEAACPGLVFAPDDIARDVRAFETVVSAIATFTPRVEVSRPGVCSLPVRGPARYFGGEESLATQLTRAVNQILHDRHGPPCRIGIADTPFVARLAAQAAGRAGGAASVRPGTGMSNASGAGGAAGVHIVPPGEAARWIADLPVSALGRPELADLLNRLGIRQIGELAALDEGVVGSRFGAEGVEAHRLARGFDDHALALSDPPPDLTVERELESPVEQVDTVAFVAAGIAEELMDRLAPHGLACTRILVEASTEHAEELSRWWRADRPFTARAMVDRVRWQLDGWLASPADAPSAGITLVRLTAGEVVPDSGRQLGLFGGPVEASHRVERGVARIQGLVGHEAVGTAVLAGGRGPSEQVRVVPWGDPREELPDARHPWPGRVPSPAPAIVHADPVPVELRDAAGGVVGVTGRGQCSSAPAEIRTAGRPAGVVGWVGPWPADERWWDPSGHRRRARLQVLLEDGSAHLLVLEAGRWGIEATYD